MIIFNSKSYLFKRSYSQTRNMISLSQEITNKLLDKYKPKANNSTNKVYNEKDLGIVD